MTGTPTSPRLRGDSRSQAAERMANQYAGGASLRGLAREHGRSYGYIRALALEGGATMRSRGGDRKRKS